MTVLDNCFEQNSNDFKHLRGVSNELSKNIFNMRLVKCSRFAVKFNFFLAFKTFLKGSIFSSHCQALFSGFFTKTAKLLEFTIVKIVFKIKYKNSIDNIFIIQ